MDNLFFQPEGGFGEAGTAALLLTRVWNNMLLSLKAYLLYVCRKMQILVNVCVFPP